MPRLTIQAARTEVLKRLGNTDDGANSPELLSQIDAHLGAVQRQLCIKYAWQMPRLLHSQTLTAGRRVYPLPATEEGIVEVRVATTGLATQRLSMGMTLDDALVTVAGTPSRFEIQTQTGVAQVQVPAGGSGYTNGAAATFSAPGGSGTTATGVIAVTAGAITGVTITDPGSGYVVPPTVTAPGGTGATLTAVLGPVDQFYLAPSPVAAGTLHTSYRAIPGSMVGATDIMVFDEETVIAITAFEIAAASKHQLAESLMNRAKEALEMQDRRAPMRPAGVGNGFQLNGK
ncbi:MAG: hypothetical protein RLZZ127_2406 [Planctomycetota bacterium]|jgi:hypothetical protein